MYVIQQPKIEIHLISRDGDTHIYEDYNDFINNTSYWFVDRHVVNTFKDVLDEWLWLYERNQNRTRYVVRDKFGSIFTKTELLNDIYKANRKRIVYRNSYHEFRSGPVPHTGKRRRGFYNWYKRPRTTQERRWNIAYIDYVRGRRHKNYLVNAWDDRPRSDGFIKRSWKKNKKTKQWM